MITLGEFTMAAAAGIVLILLALFPTVFRRIAEQIRSSIESLTSPFPATREEPIETPALWLAAIGVALILTAVLAYTYSGR